MHAVFSSFFIFVVLPHTTKENKTSLHNGWSYSLHHFIKFFS
ncbi:hypothetical protein B4153_4045 [Bacillus cereus]|uniref:Uncharacterized protein n=1 Tax=Bacillus cereus (strain AH187) TaxID=405534 RepID=B7HM24_BACC7|nr:hypothetical protein BCAH187_A3956 [Bacillus cereus AH187]KKZ94883.1 hypothetical protein B4153_4045 [Bacillus cereus]KLA06123.1 hypothetical protein B4086_3760 [Bacillus cereus]KLA13867.1 hypothetical protein B4078_3553 [Bacillus cereus]KZD53709.1 hypothetical protein B4085_1560 [Bacillus cereus]